MNYHKEPAQEFQEVTTKITIFPCVPRVLHTALRGISQLPYLFLGYHHSPSSFSSLISQVVAVNKVSAGGGTVSLFSGIFFYHLGQTQDKGSLAHCTGIFHTPGISQVCWGKLDVYINQSIV